jgi:hypothetical protein
MMTDRADRADFAGTLDAGQSRWRPTWPRPPGSWVAQGHRLTGKHAAPWKQGIMIPQSLLDTLRLW